MKKVICVIALLTAWNVPAVAATKRTALGLTEEEITVWNDRRVKGPYRVAGDVSTNSPGDWNRIDNNANTFRGGSATAETWTGQPSGSCWSPSGSPAKPGRNRGEKMRDTAFRSMVTGDANDLSHVLTGLLDQASQPGTDWSDSVRWNTNTGCLTGDGHSWEISAWLRKLLYAYDYIRHAISSANRTTLDTWFKNAGDLFEENIHKTVASRFPNRLSDDYSSSPFSSCTSSRLTHFGGHTYCSFHEAWSNRSASHVLMFGLVGLMQNDATLKDRAARWYREWLRFHVFADNTDAEFHRWTDTHPGLGWNYAGVLIAEMATLAEWFARSGDTSLINYETSDGFSTFTPAGGPKTLLGTVLLHLRHVNIAVERYGTDQAGRNGDPNYRIDSVDQLANESRIHDTYMAQANIFFNNAEITSIYLRQASGAPAYPSTVASGGYCAYCGEWGALPGVLFMFGNLGGQINPYGSVPPPIPSELVAHWTFDENTGTTAQDETANNNDGTLTNGVSWTTGKVGSAVSLDGVDDYVKIATTEFNVSQGTVALWAKPAACSSTETVMFGHTTLPQYANRIQLYIDNATCGLYLGLGDNHERHANIQNLSIGTWYRIALVWNQGVYAVYVDGVVKATGNYTGLTALQGNAHIGGIGYDPAPGSWNGALDEVKVWNYALTSVEIAADFNFYQTIPAPGSLKVSSLKTIKVAAGDGVKIGVIPTTAGPAPLPACTHYAGNTAAGNEDGSSEANRFLISPFWSVASAGHVLCLTDGTYTGDASRIAPPSGLNGTSGNPIIVRALNDGAVLIDGQNLRQPVLLVGNDWFQVIGINAANSSGDVVRASPGSDNNVFRRIVAWDAPSGTNNHVFSTGGTNNTFDEVACFGDARKCYSVQGSTGTRVSNWFGMWMRSTFDGPKMVATNAYNSYNITFENGIAMWNEKAAPTQPYGCFAQDRLDQGPWESNTKYLGGLCIVRSADAVSSWLGAIFGSRSVDGTQFKDLVLYVEPGTHTNLKAIEAQIFDQGSGLTNKCSLTADGVCTRSINDVTKIGFTAADTINGATWTTSNLQNYADIPAMNTATASPFQTSTGNGARMCFKYDNRVLTNQKLWPWSMNQRIIDAMTAAGETPVDVTGVVEGIFGTISSDCKAPTA